MEYDFGTIKVKADIETNQNQTIECLQDVKTRYSDLEHEQKEHLYAVYLNGGNEEIGDKLIGLGGNDNTPVDIQDIIRTAALVNAAAVILVHNHPSGNATATPRDIQTTQDIKEALETIGVQLLDHVIIARNQSYSMKGNNDCPFNSEVAG